MKDTVKKIKKLTTHWKKTFAKYIYSKGLVSKTHKEVLKLNSTKKFKTLAKVLNR